MKYPALMSTTEGDRAAIVPGHGLSTEVLADAEAKVIGSPPEDWFTKVEEVYFDWHPRVKNCARITGWEGCDEEGEWHGHWVDVRPNDHPETHFTVIRHTDEEPERTGSGADRG